MNDLVRDVLNHRAERLDHPEIDLAAIEAGGRRALRRQRLLTAGAGIASVAAVAVLGVAVQQFAAQPERDQRPVEQPFAAAFADRAPTYATGSTVHVGPDLRFDVGRQVTAMVQTTDGVVVVDLDGGVWFADGQEAPRQIGDAGEAYLHLRESDSLVAWTERKGDTFSVAAHDTATGKSFSAPVRDFGKDSYDDPGVAAVDDGTVWFRDADGVQSWAPASGQQPEVADPDPDYELVDVRNGTYLTNPADGGWQATVGRQLGAGQQVQVGSSGPQRLSPDGRMLLGERRADEFALYDTTTGKVLATAPEGYEFAVGYAWDDNSHYWAAGIRQEKVDRSERETDLFDLMLCTAPSDCEVKLSQIDFGPSGRFVLPYGERSS